MPTEPLDIAPLSNHLSTAVLAGPTSAKLRMEFLDVIRAIAAFAVLLEHSFERFFPGYLAWANGHFTLGVFGVSEFFLVSGFIIPVSIERYRSLKKFWIARFFRLYPLYWASIALSLAFISLGLFSRPPMLDTNPARLILANLGMLQLFVNTPNLMGLYWTLCVELIFYLLCSATFIVGLVSKSLWWAWLAIVGNLMLNLLVAMILHRSIPAGRTALLVTSFFGTLFYRSLNRQLPFSCIIKLLPFVAFSLVTGFWFRFKVFPVNNLDDSFTFLGVTTSYVGSYSLFFLLYLLRNRRFPRPFVWLGRVSYSLYLIHGFVLSLVPAGRFPLLRVALVAIFAIAASGLTFCSIERPALALHRRFVHSHSAG